MTLRVGLTHPALAQELKLTWMDYLLTMLRNRLRRKHSYDKKRSRVLPDLGIEMVRAPPLRATETTVT